MHPILSNRKRLVVYLVVWLFFTLLMELPFVLPYLSKWFVFLLIDVPLNILYALICLSSYYLCRFFPIKTGKWYNIIPTFIFAAGIAGGIELLIGTGWVHFVDSLEISSPVAAGYGPWLPGIYSWVVIIFLLIAAMHYVIIAYDQSKEAERQTLELQVLAQDAELRALRAQIDPHFLFNSLNSISALTAGDPAKARSMTIMLGNFFRKSLDLSTQKYILLEDELDLISEFLTIEQVRFGSRLKVELNVKDECRKVIIPPLLLQPLVENAVRHGIAHLIEGGTIKINCSGQGNRLFVQIDNPSDPDKPKRKGTGLGLKNVRSRLDTIYGNEAKVEVEETTEYFRVILAFPIKKS